jgi:hypothetical protein
VIDDNLIEAVLLKAPNAQRKLRALKRQADEKFAAARSFGDDARAKREHLREI